MNEDKFIDRNKEPSELCPIDWDPICKPSYELFNKVKKNSFQLTTSVCIEESCNPYSSLSTSQKNWTSSSWWRTRLLLLGNWTTPSCLGRTYQLDFLFLVVGRLPNPGAASSAM